MMFVMLRMQQHRFASWMQHHAVFTLKLIFEKMPCEYAVKKISLSGFGPV